MTIARWPWLVIVMALLSLATPASAQAPTQHPVDAAAEAGQLLQTRTQALVAGDKAAFMATVDAEASPAFKARQSESFDGWQAVPLSHYQLSVRLDDSGDLSPGLDASRYGTALTFAPETRQTYRLGQYDSTDAINSLWLTYVLRADGWKVAADDDLTAIGLTTAVNLWEIAPVEIRSTEHFLLIADRSQQPRLTELASIAEDAFGVFSARWSSPWSQRVPLLLPASNEQAQRVLDSNLDLQNFVAFVSYSPVRTPDYAISAPRMFAGFAGGPGRDRNSQVADFVHELVHVATAPTTGPFTPIWLQEGLAEYVRLGRPAPTAVTSSVLPELPGPPAFAVNSSLELRLAYDTSLLAVAQLSQAKGPNAAMELMNELSDRSDAPGSPAFNREAALEAVTGLSTSELNAKLKR